ncbi:flagellar motor switch protein FliG [Lawsonia intracellularis]|uniref:Flagellar motor switch protein FliG n=1 Tax=Lawsonia intracellularis (strain PHE/MN1-00) TaxID=363253 RepID=Q1MQ17_LAWIP|nr:flagellar motor switch protein FliG [Lawsonia intracellularis]AGC50280.1 flagellar motor switch protein [Lawsonia intracellularis N343]KAA0204301.1 flagellar motor switch protein FliG [Lawsonia intracellularis]MBZ3892722.1 flagellar motor switch protein FliG [Lawsonia intracellularis]RBN33112.1 flagellar motor switch protein FliG [Lawsonia intracellularis]CAJ54910.1 Flagellar motor switch protein [Lawsonia intracellularis PHE/MN1-00]
MELTGTQKAAVLLLVLGDKFTAEVFKRMERREIAAISKAVIDLDTVSKDTVEDVLRTFHQDLVTGKDLIIGGQDSLKRMLMKNLDGETAKYIMDSLNVESGPAPFKELEKVSPKLLSQMLRNEHPQTLALILGHLSPEQAASLLIMLPAGVRAEVLIRLAKLESVPEDMLVEVDRVLQSQLIAMGSKEGKKVGGVQSVAEILNAVDRATEEEVLAEIEEDSAQMAEDIRNLMFVFEDIKGLDDRSIREVLKETSNEELTLALRGASDELKEYIFRNMSERGANMVREELEFMGPTKLSDVEQAQQNIVKIVRRLEGEGKVTINHGSGDVFL